MVSLLLGSVACNGDPSLIPVEEDVCTAKACVNGGCHDVDGVAICECDAGFEGEQCEVGVTEFEELATDDEDAAHHVRGISRWGKIAVGYVESDEGVDAFAWSSESGVVRLAALSEARFSQAVAVSDDGSLVVGASINADGSTEAVIWRLAGSTSDGRFEPALPIEASEPEALGFLDTSSEPSSFARAISQDGSIVFGDAASDLGTEPFRWTASEGIVGLGVTGSLVAVSADGSVIAGNDDEGAFLFTEGEGKRPLSTPEAGSARAFDVSADGRTVVGILDDYDLFRWTDSEGFTLSWGIESFVEAFVPVAVSANEDASVIVATDQSDDPVIWDEASSFRPLTHALADGGVDIEPYRVLRSADAISPDGSTIAGQLRTSGKSFLSRLPYAVDVDDCALDPCLGGAECLERAVGYACECPDELSGSNCGFLRRSVPADTTASPRALSADGSVLVGAAFGPGGNRPILWDGKPEAEELGVLPDEKYGEANAVSADGKVVVGQSGERAFRWSRAEGVSALAQAEGATIHSPQGTSADGAVIVGSFYEPSKGFEACRWTDTGLSGLGDPPDARSSVASVVSADGSVIAGVADVDGVRSVAFRWTEAQGMQVLPSPEGAAWMKIGAISADGAPIVGAASADNGQSSRPFRYSEELGMELIDVPGRVLHAEAIGVGDDNVVLGTADDRGFVWSDENGFAYLDEVLEGSGIRTGPELRVMALSGDGAFVAGTRKDSFSHVPHVFVVALPEHW